MSVLLRLKVGYALLWVHSRQNGLFQLFLFNQLLLATLLGLGIQLYFICQLIIRLLQISAIISNHPNNKVKGSLSVCISVFVNRRILLTSKPIWFSITGSLSEVLGRFIKCWPIHFPPLSPLSATRGLQGRSRQYHIKQKG